MPDQPPDAAHKPNATSGPVAPVQPGDRLLLASALTGRSQPMWAEVDLVGWYLPELILGGDAGMFPWKIGYRIRGNGNQPDQLGVVWIDNERVDPDAFLRGYRRAT